MVTCARACSRILAAVVLAASFALAPSCGGGGDGIGGILLALFTASQPSPGANTVSMQRGTSSNNVFEVEIMATDVNDFFGAAFTVSYPSQVTFESWDHSASFLRDGGLTDADLALALKNNPGELVIGIARKQNQPGTVPGVNVSATRELLSLTFRATAAIAAPGADISFTGNLEVRDSAQPAPGNLIPVTWAPGKVTVTRQ